MKSQEIYTEKHLYPNKILFALGEFGICDEEKSLIEEYLWSTYGGESIWYLRKNLQIVLIGIPISERLTF